VCVYVCVYVCMYVLRVCACVYVCACVCACVLLPLQYTATHNNILQYFQSWHFDTPNPLAHTHTPPHVHTLTLIHSQGGGDYSFMPEGQSGWLGLLPGTVLQRVAACCSVLQCVAVCCSELQCVAVDGIIRACPKDEVNDLVFCQVLCCIVLQCVAVCCSVLQFMGLFVHARRTRWMI